MQDTIIWKLALGAALGAMVSACDSGDKGGDKAGGKANKAAQAGGEVFTGDKPTLPAEVAAAPFGKPKQEVFAALGVDSTYVSSKQQPGIGFSLDFDKQAGLKAINVSTEEPAQDALTALWGEPLVNKRGEAFWFNPEKTLRAWLPEYGKGKTVVFDHYTPIATFLGKEGKAIAFLTAKPLLGATLDELREAHGDALCNFDKQAPGVNAALAEPDLRSRRMKLQRAYLWLCPPLFEMTPRQQRDQIYIGPHGKVDRVGLRIVTDGSAGFRDQVLALLDSKLGKPSVVESDRGIERYYFDPEARLKVRVAYAEDRDIHITFGPYLPIKDLLGGDQPGLSIENPAMLGGTFEENQKADPTHYFQSGSELATLIYPPTEYNNQSTDVDLQRWAGKKKVHGYRLVIHYKDHPEHGEEVFSLLKARFGEPKKDRRSTDKDEFWKFEQNGRKVEARRVSEQWQITITS